MNRLAAQLLTVRDGLLRQVLQWCDSSATPAFSVRPAVNRAQQQVDEDRELSALPVIAMAAIFNLTTPDALAFPDKAFNVRKQLFGFPFES